MKYFKGYFLKYIVFALLGIFLLGYVVMLLWNWLMPEITNFRPVSYWQALGLLVLSKILFSGFGGRFNRPGGSQHTSYKIWRHRMESKMAQMTEEEKSQFKKELARRCGCQCDSD